MTNIFSDKSSDYAAVRPLYTVAVYEWLINQYRTIALSAQLSCLFRYGMGEVEDDIV